MFTQIVYCRIILFCKSPICDSHFDYTSRGCRVTVYSLANGAIMVTRAELPRGSLWTSHWDYCQFSPWRPFQPTSSYTARYQCRTPGPPASHHGPYGRHQQPPLAVSSRNVVFGVRYSWYLTLETRCGVFGGDAKNAVRRRLSDTPLPRRPSGILPSLTSKINLPLVVHANTTGQVRHTHT